MRSELNRNLLSLFNDFEKPKRTAITKKVPVLRKPVIFFRQSVVSTKNFINPRLRGTKRDAFLPIVVARHQSLLRRKLGTSDANLQEKKIINLKRAIGSLDGIIILPGKKFSLWHSTGKPTARRGYVDGMLLSDGKVTEGIGGGLCQLSNLLYWLFLHAPVEILERHHHSRDVFPDSGRTLPFGSGATILYNFIDLRVKNISDTPLQLKLWLTDNHIKGQLRAVKNVKSKYHVYEKNHLFIKKDGHFFRYNEIWRDEKVNGTVVKVEKITTNFAPVLYEVSQTYLRGNNFKVIDVKDL